jgi:hypothetical protein
MSDDEIIQQRISGHSVRAIANEGGKPQPIASSARSPSPPPRRRLIRPLIELQERICHGTPLWLSASARWVCSAGAGSAKHAQTYPNYN